jgi:uncharacterized membrane protein
MKTTSLALLHGLLAFGLLTACQTFAPDDSETAPGNWNVLSDADLATTHGHIDFVKHVKPILEAKCVICHNHATLPGFSLENRKEAFAGGPLGRRIMPGRPEDSALLIHVTTAHFKVQAMPPVGERLTKDERRILTAWVKQGAWWPRGKAGVLNPNAASGG